MLVIIEGLKFYAGMILLLPLFEDPLRLLVLVCPLPLAAGSGSQEGHMLEGIVVGYCCWCRRVEGSSKSLCGGWFELKELKKTKGNEQVCWYLYARRRAEKKDESIGLVVSFRKDVTLLCLWRRRVQGLFSFPSAAATGHEN